MGKKKRRIFPKKKRSVFSRPHPIRRKMMLRHRKMKAYFHKHNPRMFIQKNVRRMVGGGKRANRLPDRKQSLSPTNTHNSRGIVDKFGMRIRRIENK